MENGLKMNTFKFQMPPLTGPLKELLLQSRTKDNVDHVGLSQQQEMLKDIGKSTREPYQTCPNNN